MIYRVINSAKILNKEFALMELFAIYSILGLVTISLTCDYLRIKEFGIFFITIFLPLFVIQISDKVIFNEYKDGIVELYLTVFTPFEIIINRFFSISILYIISYLLTLPFIMLFVGITFKEIMVISYLTFLNIMVSIIISILVSCCNCYFKKITLINFIINIPLILPNLIISGLIITNSYDIRNLIYILSGITLIICPIAISLSSFLIKNLYSFAFSYNIQKGKK